MDSELAAQVAAGATAVDSTSLPVSLHGNPEETCG
jgi:hypothetical protein